MYVKQLLMKMPMPNSSGSSRKRFKNSGNFSKLKELKFKKVSQKIIFKKVRKIKKKRKHTFTRKMGKTQK